MKKLFILISALISLAYAQTCPPVTSPVASSIGPTSARTSWTAAAGSIIYQYTLYKMPSRTFVTSGSGTATFKDWVGLAAVTTYRAVITNICISGTPTNASAPDSVSFTTLSDGVNYTPLGNTKVPYFKVDSNLLILCGDTSRGRAPNVMGQLKMRCADSLFYYYDGHKWRNLSIDSLGIVALLNDKVDSVTIVGDILYYWKQGVGFGYTLPAVANDTTYFQNGGPPGFNLLRKKNDSTLQVKSLVLPYGDMGDSTTTDSTLIITRDTTLIATVLQVQHRIDSLAASIVKADTVYRTPGVDSIKFTINGRYHAIKDSTGGGATDTIARMGYYVNPVFASGSLPADLTSTTGAATITPAVGKVTISGGDGNYFNNNVRAVKVSSSNNYVYRAGITIVTKPTNAAGGLWIGKQSTNTTQKLSMYVTLQRTHADSVRLAYMVQDGSSNGTIQDSSRSIYMANSQTYTLEVSQNQFSVSAKLRRIVTGAAVEQADIFHTIPDRTVSVMPNIGQASFGVLGGTFEVTSFSEYDYDIKNPYATVIGTSISQYFSASTPSNHYIEKLGLSGRSITNYGQGANKFVDVASYALPQLWEDNPTLVIIELGANDGRSDIRSYLPQLIDTINAHGKDILVIQTVRDVDRDTTIHNVCFEKAVKLSDAGRYMIANQYQADGVHLNDLGFDYLARYTNMKFPDLFTGTGFFGLPGIDGLHDVQIDYSTINHNKALVYDSLLRKWTPNSLSSLFIQNQISANQTADYRISGYGQINSGLAVGGANVGGVKLQVYDNVADAMIVRYENAAAPVTLGGFPYGRIMMGGYSGYGVTGWPGAFIFNSFADGGSVYHSYAGPQIWQMGTSYLEKMRLTQGGALGLGGTPVASALVDLNSTTQGFLPPRMTTTQKNAISSPAEGLVVYDLTLHKLCVYTGSAWETITSL